MNKLVGYQLLVYADNTHSLRRYLRNNRPQFMSQQTGITTDVFHSVWPRM